MTAMIAREVAGEHEKKGKHYQWPDGAVRDEATAEAEFPKPVWTDAKARFEKLDPQKRAEMREDLEVYYAEGIKEATAAIKTEGFFASFSLFDILWFLLAVGSAFSIGSGAAIGGDDD